MNAQIDPQETKGPKKGNILVGLVVSLVMAVLTYQLTLSMLNPALPNVAKSLNVNVDQVSQVTSLLLLVSSICGVVLARWSDFIGRRRALILILLLVAVGTLLCIFAPNLPVLLIGRVLQGAAGAAFSLCYVILKEMLSEKTFGTALGILTAVNGGVGGVDAYVAGMLSDTVGFRSIFVVILVFNLLALLGVLFFVPKDNGAKAAGRMDWWGAVAITGVLVFMTYFIDQGSSVGWLTPGTLILLLGTVVSAVVFWFIEKKGASPLIATKHLRSRQVWPVVTTTLLSLAGVFAVINFTIVMLSQDNKVGFGVSAGTSGLLFLMPPAIIGVVCAPLSGLLAGKWGWIRVLRLGLACNIADLIVISLFPQNQWVVFAMVAVMGITYYGMILTTVNGLGALLSPDDAPAALPGINGAAFGMGASVGIPVVSTLVGMQTVSGYITALWISIGITILAFMASLLILPKKGQKI